MRRVCSFDCTLQAGIVNSSYNYKDFEMGAQVQVIEELQQAAIEIGLPRRRLALAVKRVVDIILALIGLLFLGPLILFLAWLVRRDSPGPAFYVQKRVGQNGRVFDMYKLRTMVVGAETIGPGHAVENDDPRITRLGRWLRATSLDELPQLWNILRGEMSFIGPRPLLVKYLDRWTPRQKKRLLMPQGITVWAQINGRNELDWDTKFEMDVWYVENWSLWLDFVIALRTIWAVLTRRGITGENGVPEFTGNGE